MSEPLPPEVEPTVPGEDPPPATPGDASSPRVAPWKPPRTPAELAWLDRFVWIVLWKVVAVGLATTALLFAAYEARHLIGLLVTSTFFALALIPGVTRLQRRFGWRRGAAVGFMYVIGVIVVALLVAVLIPGIVRFANAVGDQAPGWISQLNDLGQTLFGVPLIDQTGGADATDALRQALAGWAGNILGVVSSSIGVVFDLLTIASFTFYIAADYPRIERALLSRMTPARQQKFGWVSDVSIDQTGGYFYSRLLLMIINGSLSFVVMMVIGLPLVFSLPMALFMGFVSEFIPVIGTFIGAAIPILVTLGVKGIGSALVLLAWATVYQQVENLVLSPRLSAKTMELNGAVAFGAALAGGAIAGPMGAFMALPVAAMITAVIKNSGTTYEVVYRLKHDIDDGDAVPSQAPEGDGV
ncbi:AI-2E family transporter [Actinotalea sp. M2MS4P-6]|uniref:AI-2E family transporter n=1 Tax=Actinotalea sp. M2MS4P-6 TaxID=2983762 RepID=UPI0021E46612|nr:AI-2E family transporter [Actinotalea sp. M2MS4P-6]MCV2394262.1 AI-2E family transporter [Actinotalea sp. M2MS4P-6]